MTPLTTCLTLPVLFSSTRKSSGPRKAMPVGSVSPETTVFTDRFGSSMHGPGPAQLASTVVTTVAELLLGLGSGWSAVTVAVLLMVPIACGVTTIVPDALEPTPSVPMLQRTVLVPLQAPCVAVAETNVTFGKVSVTWTPVATAGPWLMVL